MPRATFMRRRDSMRVGEQPHESFGKQLVAETVGARAVAPACAAGEVVNRCRRLPGFLRRKLVQRRAHRTIEQRYRLEDQPCSTVTQLPSKLLGRHGHRAAAGAGGKDILWCASG